MPDETISPYGRGDCSVCGREMNLKKNGTIRYHLRGRRSLSDYRSPMCPGTDHPAAEKR